MLESGKQFPAFSLPDQEGITRTLADFAGKWLVVFFYSKDNTSGCTNEARDFAFLHAAFAKSGAAVAGVSKDTVKSHAGFAAKYELPYTLLSDAGHDLLEAAGVWKKKNMHGKEVMGVVRTTALVDPKGIVHTVWSRVKVPGHAAAVLGTLEEAGKQ